ncbi:MAG: L,D-transpeptidase family protein [Geobacteraceae bacterium]|nr:L,D-transpeptidase family protein [Geobacteraceae bacterium]
MRYVCILIAIFSSLPLPAHGGTYPGDMEIVGIVKKHKVRQGESLIELARSYDLGYNEIAAANPNLDPFVPPTGATVVIPTAWILPAAVAPETVVINLSEMRLYYLSDHEQSSLLATFPIGIGKEGSATPAGDYRIVEKAANPSWTVPSSIRKEKPWLPRVVPAGPENPLGSHALRLSEGSILIHGTNRPLGVGRRASHGCLRLYPEDIPRLFALVSIGTEVAVVREPVKVGSKGRRVYIEVHRDDELKMDYGREANRLLADRELLERVDGGKLDAAILEKRGIPVDITK